jgi:two-component system, cell cycle sensor histidine kinase and response regulator CckA
LTDVVTPVMNGRTLADQIRRIHPETRVLYMSGHTADAIVRHNVREPETSLLEKLFTPIELARRVRETLDAA